MRLQVHKSISTNFTLAVPRVGNPARMQERERGMSQACSVLSYCLKRLRKEQETLEKQMSQEGECAATCLSAGHQMTSLSKVQFHLWSHIKGCGGTINPNKGVSEASGIWGRTSLTPVWEGI